MRIVLSQVHPRVCFYRLPGAGQQTVGVVVVVVVVKTKLQIYSLSSGKQPKQLRDEAESVVKAICRWDSTL